MISFDNTYARELPGFYSPFTPKGFPQPALLRWNGGLAEELGLSVDGLSAEQLARWCSGSELPDGAQPIAQAYAGHQFGNFVPQLGDGRALLLGEVIDRHGRRRDIAFKGSGPTAYSRGGDGKAAVGPVLREYVVGEAMHALGIPTTRALAAVATGEPVRRERSLPGAVLTRVAASHIRVGTFQYFAVRGDVEKLRRLVNYVIARHYPEIEHSEITDDADRYVALLRAVTGRQASLIAQWMHVGFIHGVMNTDNMTISGETIDYGPCAFMEAYDPATVFSSIDRGGRYAYGRQPAIAQWNLARFAETLLPLIDEAEQDRAVERATEVLQQFATVFAEAWLAGMRRKLGLATSADDDRALVDDWLALMQKDSVDFTLAWRRLADAVEHDAPSLNELFGRADDLEPWLQRWRRRLATEARQTADIAAGMRMVNPIYIPRNQRVEEALAAATDDGDLRPFERLLDAVTKPFEERPGYEIFAESAAGDFASCFRTFCGT